MSCIFDIVDHNLRMYSSKHIQKVAWKVREKKKGDYSPAKQIKGINGVNQSSLFSLRYLMLLHERGRSHVKTEYIYILLIESKYCGGLSKKKSICYFRKSFFYKCPCTSIIRNLVRVIESIDLKSLHLPSVMLAFYWLFRASNFRWN